ncbi:hypothetical protein R1A27_17195 [Methylobacterium sp. NMS12]
MPLRNAAEEANHGWFRLEDTVQLTVNFSVAQCIISQLIKRVRIFVSA